MHSVHVYNDEKQVIFNEDFARVNLPALGFEPASFSSLQLVQLSQRFLRPSYPLDAFINLVLSTIFYKRF